jgi:hypothetical protein
MLQVSRRQWLTGTGSMAASAAAWSSLATHASLQAERSGLHTVVLQDSRLQMPEDVRAQLAGNGSRILTLDGDVVRMWRGEQGPLLADRATQLLGATLWPAFLLVRGLAAESGRRVRYERFDAGSGATVWLIA